MAGTVCISRRSAYGLKAMNPLAEAGRNSKSVLWSFSSALVIAVLAGIGVPSKSAPSDHPRDTAQPPHVKKDNMRPVQWVVWRRLGENSFRIGNHFAWCPNAWGSNAPRIVGVRQIDRPKRVMLIVYLVSGKTSGCLGVAAQLERVVHIRGGLHGRELFDGSQSPAVRRWPRWSAG